MSCCIVCILLDFHWHFHLHNEVSTKNNESFNVLNTTLCNPKLVYDCLEVTMPNGKIAQLKGVYFSHICYTVHMVNSFPPGLEGNASIRELITTYPYLFFHHLNTFSFIFHTRGPGGELDRMENNNTPTVSTAVPTSVPSSESHLMYSV